MVFLDLAEHMQLHTEALKVPISLTSTASSTAEATSTVIQSSESKEINVTGQNISSENSVAPTVQTTGTPVFNPSVSGLSFSSLSQNHNSSSIILQNVSPGGLVTNANLMRLPKSSTVEKSYSALVNTGDNQKLRLVLNMAAQETYSAEDKADFSLPAVFDRDTRSIVRVEAEHRITEESLKIVKPLDGLKEQKTIEAPSEANSARFLGIP